MDNINKVILRNNSYAKIRLCSGDYAIIKIAEIEIIISQGDICTISVKNMPTTIKTKAKLTEFESLLNLTQATVIPV